MVVNTRLYSRHNSGYKSIFGIQWWLQAYIQGTMVVSALYSGHTCSKDPTFWGKWWLQPYIHGTIVHRNLTFCRENI